MTTELSWVGTSTCWLALRLLRSHHETISSFNLFAIKCSCTPASLGNLCSPLLHSGGDVSSDTLRAVPPRRVQLCRTPHRRLVASYIYWQRPEKKGMNPRVSLRIISFCGHAFPFFCSSHRCRLCLNNWIPSAARRRSASSLRHEPSLHVSTAGSVLALLHGSAERNPINNTHPPHVLIGVCHMELRLIFNEMVVPPITDRCQNQQTMGKKKKSLHLVFQTCGKRWE